MLSPVFRLVEKIDESDIKNSSLQKPLCFLKKINPLTVPKSTHRRSWSKILFWEKNVSREEIFLSVWKWKKLLFIAFFSKEHVCSNESIQTFSSKPLFLLGRVTTFQKEQVFSNRYYHYTQISNKLCCAKLIMLIN